MFDLADLLERHIRKEERELFPLFEQNLSADQAESAGKALKQILDAKTPGE
jgi:hemerythrin-like domain-containing protein